MTSLYQLFLCSYTFPGVERQKPPTRCNTKMELWYMMTALVPQTALCWHEIRVLKALVVPLTSALLSYPPSKKHRNHI